MKIQLCNGGLANQVFQYIFARHLELATGEICYLDDSTFYLGHQHNGYEMEKIWGAQISPHCLSKEFTEDVWEWMLSQIRDREISMHEVLRENGIKMELLEEGKTCVLSDGQVIQIPWNQFQPSLLTIPGSLYYYGYWINREYFHTYREQFQGEFIFPPIVGGENQSVEEKIQKEFSIGVHIRRGDYVNVGWNLPEDYYYNAMKKISREYCRAWFFIFSDDIEWCKEHAKDLGFEFTKGKIVFVTGNLHGKNYLDMQLLSQCKGYIMSNSAFCYLAVLLNRRKPQIAINPTAHRQI